MGLILNKLWNKKSYKGIQKSMNWIINARRINLALKFQIKIFLDFKRILDRNSMNLLITSDTQKKPRKLGNVLKIK